MKKIYLTFATIVLFAIGFAASDKDESSDNSSTGSKPQTEQKQETEAEYKVPETKEETPKKFFENGYVYTASYSVHRNKGYGLSGSYNYRIKIFKDGTSELLFSSEIEDIGKNEPQMYNCKIEKKRGSHRDFSATWYEVKWGSGNSIYVDEKGNVIELNVNGNNKDIFEAIATGDCIYGKFTKEKLTQTQNHVCKTCGKEYNPEKEAIVSEEYCYADYPQICSTCNKTYTINTEGPGACKGTCSSCFEKYENKKIYERVTGRTY